MSKVLEKQFDAAMMGIYHSAWEEIKYKATRFHQMLCDHGGLETAKILLHSNNVSEGYTALWERKRLDLTVEALILKSQWDELFTEADREIARKRLSQYGYNNLPASPIPQFNKID